MLPHTHFLLGLLAGLLGVKLNIISYWHALAIVILSVGMDSDHLISSHKKFRTWSPLKCWNAGMNSQYTNPPLHTKKAFLIIALFSAIVYNFYQQIGFVLLAAYIPHYLADIVGRLIKYKHEKRIKIKNIILPLNPYEITIDIILLALVVPLILLLFL